MSADPPSLALHRHLSPGQRPRDRALLPQCLERRATERRLEWPHSRHATTVTVHKGNNDGTGHPQTPPGWRDMSKPAFEKTLEAMRAGRRDPVGASADLAAVATEIAEQVRLLDGLVRYRFGDNAELMGAWSSARNVLGPFRSRSEPVAGDGQTPSEAGPDAVKPAA